MTLPGALEVICDLVKKAPQVILGAGTVVDSETARECIDAGAQFISNPALDLPTVQLVAKNPNVIMISGALTPTEVLAAWKAGADFVKIFPCSLVGADNYIRTLKRPFPDIPLIAGGGVNQQNAAHYILRGGSTINLGKEFIPRAPTLPHNPHTTPQL